MKRHALGMALLSMGILGLLAGEVEALSLSEAVTLGLENNHRIKEYEGLARAQEERVGSSESAFWPRVDLRYQYENRENTYAFQTDDASVFAVEASYNIFNGLKDLMSVRASRSSHDAAIFQKQAISADVTLDVKRAYIAVLRSQKSAGVEREAVDLLERQRAEAEMFFRSGLTAKNELLKVEVELASARQNLLEAERNVQIARKAMERVIGVQLSPEEEFEEIGVVPRSEYRVEDLEEMMIERRSELRFLRALLRSREYSRQAVRGAYFPSVDLVLTHERYGEQSAFEGREAPLFDDDTRALLVARWNIFDGFRTTHDVRAEDREIEAIAERIRDTEAEFTLRLKAAIEEYRMSASRIEVAEKAVGQAQENYRINENQYRQRVATTTDLLDARFLLTRSQNEHNNALYNLYLAVAVVERLIEEEHLSREMAN